METVEQAPSLLDVARNQPEGTYWEGSGDRVQLVAVKLAQFDNLVLEAIKVIAERNGIQYALPFKYKALVTHSFSFQTEVYSDPLLLASAGIWLQSACKEFDRFLEGYKARQRQEILDILDS